MNGRGSPRPPFKAFDDVGVRGRHRVGPAGAAWLTGSACRPPEHLSGKSRHSFPWDGEGHLWTRQAGKTGRRPPGGPRSPDVIFRPCLDVGLRVHVSTSSQPSFTWRPRLPAAHHFRAGLDVGLRVHFHLLRTWSRHQVTGSGPDPGFAGQDPTRRPPACTFVCAFISDLPSSAAGLAATCPPAAQGSPAAGLRHGPGVR
jgi:hypothetical protein